MLAAQTLSRSLQGSAMLTECSFSIESGRIAAVIGPSGAGKSSLLRSVALIDSADRGTVIIGNTRYEQPLNRRSLKENPYPTLTVVFQQLFVWPHLTIRQNITLPQRNSYNQALFSSLIDQLCLQDFLDRYPNEVSQGQRQRASLARALLLRPRYLLLDEITANLDWEHTVTITKILRASASEGTTILMVTHDLTHVAAQADQVIFMEQGRIVEQGSDSILRTPTTPELKRFVGGAWAR